MKMIKKLKIFILILVVGFISSCEKESILYPEEQQYIAFSQSSANFAENMKTGTLQIYLTSTTEISKECNLAISTEGLSNPAVEGTDFTISTKTVNFENGSGFVNISISLIDNDDIDGKKDFYITINSVTEGVNIGIDGRNKILVSIADDEHPLGYFKGDYSHAGTSVWTGGDATWSASIIPDPDNTNQILINQFGVSNLSSTGHYIAAKVNKTNKTISIVGKQRLVDSKPNNYYHAVNSGDPATLNKDGELDPLEDPILGTYTINEDKTEIEITFTNWGVKWMDPDDKYDGKWWWNFFTSSTLTKTSK